MKTIPSQKKLLLFEKFISILIIFRLHLTELNPLVYHLIVITFLIIKYFREGNTAGSILQYLSVIFLLVSDLLGVPTFTFVGIAVTILNIGFVSPNIYTLPEFSPKVGLRENSLRLKNNNFYYAEWFPVQQKENKEVYRTPWAHTIEISKMAKYMKLDTPLKSLLFRFFISSVQRYKVTYLKGELDVSKGTILFSHGRGGTPYFYSTFMRFFAREWKILAPQHSEVNITPFTEINEVKKFREQEVKERAEEIVKLVSKVPDNDSIVLMGHSYGCATVIQAYKLIPLGQRKRISHIVLLDPWFFPLPEDVFNDEIICPVLILANEDLVDTEDVNMRNKKFMSRHGNAIYCCWKGGDHLHQTDQCFFMGSSFKLIKNSHDSWKMMERNLLATQMFLNSEKIDEELIKRFDNEFGDVNLGINFTPLKWGPKFTF